MARELYFAYGSNMDLEHLADRIPNQYEIIGAAKLLHWEWLINQRGYANIKASHRSEVYGALFRITEEGLKGLDRYEGYPSLYTRCKLPVIFQERTFHPWVYIDPNSIQPGAPREGYLERVIIGSMEFRLPSQYISKLTTFLPY